MRRGRSQDVMGAEKRRPQLYKHTSASKRHSAPPPPPVLPPAPPPQPPKHRHARGQFPDARTGLLYVIRKSDGVGDAEVWGLRSNGNIHTYTLVYKLSIHSYLR